MNYLKLPLEMKNLSLLLLIFLSLSLTSCKQNAAKRIKNDKLEQAKMRDQKEVKGLPKIYFKNREFDFGTIQQGEKTEGSFVFKNTGESDLIISNAKASCGCTVPEYPKNVPIKPGEEGEIKVLFNSKGKSNKQNKTVTIFTNTLEGQERLTVKGFVNVDKNKDQNKQQINYIK